MVSGLHVESLVVLGGSINIVIQTKYPSHGNHVRIEAKQKLKRSVPSLSPDVKKGCDLVLGEGQGEGKPQGNVNINPPKEPQKTATEQIAKLIHFPSPWPSPRIKLEDFFMLWGWERGRFVLASTLPYQKILVHISGAIVLIYPSPLSL